jgi:predicted amidohydrolase YtcJ
MRPRSSAAWMACALALLVTREIRAEEMADVVIVNAPIYTAAKRERAQAMAIRGGRILAIGGDQEIRGHIGPATEVWDLTGAAVVPGLIDSHGHLAGLGERLAIVDLFGTRNLDEVVARVASRAQHSPEGEWVRGRGWDQNDWPVMAMPEHASLTAATPAHPVALERVDGHALLVNRLALERAGIDRNTPDPAGGKIEHDAAGELSGVLVDNAMDLVERVIPPPGQAESERRLVEALRACARVGLTMVHDAGIGRTTWALYRSLLERQALPIRVYAMASASDSLVEDVLAGGGLDTDRLMLRAVKVVYDGALGSRGALLSAPYSDRPGHVGLERTTVDSLARLCRRARSRGVQVRVHAIGDLANTRVLDAYQQAFGGEPHPELRWAIEHAQVVRPEDIRRFARLGVVASMQATHATSDGPWAEERLGPERIRWSYAWRQFLRAKVRFANGSDFPVESESPMLGLYAAITRRDLEGRLPAGGWRREEALTAEEALRSFSLWGAWLAFREADLGSLEPGKLADFVVLDRDPFARGPESLPATRVLRTVVGGVTAFDASH